MKKKKARRGRRAYQEITYCLEILNYDVAYSFSWTSGKLLPGPYWEYSAIEIKGKILCPEDFKDREISGTLLGSRDDVKALADPDNYKYEPKAVGRITLRGKESTFIISIPFDALPLLSQLLRDERIKFLVLRGTALFRGSSNTKSIRFEKEFDPQDQT